MLIFSYRLLQLIFFPVILIIGLIRIFNKKEREILDCIDKILWDDDILLDVRGLGEFKIANI